jgi:post-segregation antitoxin (ccd killing protein)
MTAIQALRQAAQAKLRLITMNVSVPIPDDLAQRLSAAGVDLSRRALEGFALEEYKAGRVTKAELRRWLGIETRYELDGFLKAHGVFMKASVEDLRRDVATLERLGF